MKTRITNYTFNKTAKTITFNDYGTIALDAFLLITNVTTNTIIYNFTDPLKGGTVLTNVLTLDYDTSAMSNTDSLSIYYDDGINNTNNSVPKPDYISDVDFTVTYTSASTVTLTGLSFTLNQGINIAYVKVTNTSTNTTRIYQNGIDGYTLRHSSGVVTAYLNGAITSIFTVNDMYEMGINAQLKGFDPTTDTIKVTEQSPNRNAYVRDTMYNSTNLAAATNYFPSATGLSMDGSRDLSTTFNFVDADGTITFTVEVTNGEDPATATWIQLYGSDLKNNVMANSWTITNGTLTGCVFFDNLNVSYVRFVVVNNGATNTIALNIRRKA